jgi:heme-degrading monooxygenase HmoA
MIARMWSAQATRENSLRYLKHFSREVSPALAKIEGYLSAHVMTRPMEAPEGQVEIVVTTYWSSFEAIDAFAGADRQAAVVAPEAAALFLDYDRRVRHFDVAVSDKH